MLENPPKINRAWFKRPTTWIIAYFGVGLIFSITTLFTSTGDLPNAVSFWQMIREFPRSTPDLFLATLFWVIMPTVTWPLVILFQIIYMFY